MDITNGSGTDTRYTVKSSGGSGMAPPDHCHPFRQEEIAHWPLIPAGSAVQHTPKSPGPWQVCFYVAGQGIVAEAKSDNDQVKLVPDDGSFKAEVLRVPRSSAKPAKPRQVGQG
ncbi:MAG: hypothetical protein JF614_22630 [Acidobacteria bacterium]|nr:hypothetical protein [Acidobacteriota bacterium]